MLIQEAVPNVLNQNVDPKVRRQRQRLADLFDGSRPSVFFGDRTAHRRNQQDRGPAVGVRIANGSFKRPPPLFTLGRIGIGQGDLPVHGVHDPGDANANFLGGGNHLGGRQAVGRIHLDPVKTGIFRTLEPVFQGLAPGHAELASFAVLELRISIRAIARRGRHRRSGGGRGGGRDRRSGQTRGESGSQTCTKKRSSIK